MQAAAGIDAHAAGGAVMVAIAAPAAAAAPQPRAAREAPPRRETVAKVLFVLGCAAAALAIFGPTTLQASTDADAVADLRGEAQELLLLSSAQVLAPTVAVLVPERPFFAIFACASAGITSGHVASFLYTLAACNGGLHGELLGWYIFFNVTLLSALVTANVISFKDDV